MRHSKFYSGSREHSKTFMVITVYVVTLECIYVMVCIH